MQRFAEEHAVGVRVFNRRCGGTAFVGAKPNIAADDHQPLVNLPELPNPVVAIPPSHAAVQWIATDATSDGDQYDVLVLVVMGTEFPVQPIVLAIQSDETVDLCGVRKIDLV